MDGMVKNPYIIVQARMNSERLPGKVLKTINGKTLLGILMERVKPAGIPIIIATSINLENDAIEREANKYNVDVFRGSENNVLERYYLAAKQVNADPVFRLTADNPLMEGKLLNQMLQIYDKQESERTYMSIGLSKTYPLGISAELFSFELLEEAFKNVESDVEKEHVTPYMHKNRPGNITFIPFASNRMCYHYRLTIDTLEDFNLHELLIKQYNADKLAVDEIIQLLDNNPALSLINRHVSQKRI